MRLYGLSRGEIAGVILAGRIVAHDWRGRPIFKGLTRDGRPIQVVLALDVPNFVITVFDESR